MRSILFKSSIIFFSVLFAANLAYCQDDDTAKNVLKQGLLGAGTGAVGGVLLDAITKPSSSSSSRRRSAPAADDEYYEEDDQGDYYYEEPPQESSTQKVLKQGLLGAGTGAIASGASGGNAGKGALIGAGTGVIGGALLDMLTTPSKPKRVYRKAPRATAQPRVVTQQSVQQPQAAGQNIQVSEEAAGTEGGKKKIIKKYDATGKLVSEEEVYF